jgi:hypothetical protein
MTFKPVKSAVPKKRAMYKKPDNPEYRLQKQWIEFLKARGWHVVEMHASPRLSGFPDLYITHVKYGARLVEIKLPNMKGSRFTEPQWEKFPLLDKNGSPIWIITEVSEDNYRKLFTHKKGNLAGWMNVKL